MSKLCEHISHFCRKKIKNSTDVKGDLYTRIKNVYQIQPGNLDEENVIFLPPNNQTVSSNSSLETRVILQQEIDDIKDKLYREPRSEEYIDQATHLIEDYQRYKEICHAYDLSQNVLGMDTITHLSQMSSGAFGKFVNAKNTNDVVQPKLSYTTSMFPCVQDNSLNIRCTETITNERSHQDNTKAIVTEID